MRVLIIGGGAIGVVFARHFQQGGAEVGLLVRPRQREATEAGVPMYAFNRPKRDHTTPERFEVGTVYDEQSEALKASWDLIVLAVSNVALDKGTWLTELVDGSDAPVLAFVNGPATRGIVEQRVPAERLLWGMLNVISYQAPLPHETLPEPGLAYWFPPGGLGISGTDPFRDSVVGVLKKGGLPAKKAGDVHSETAFVGAILSRTVLALELAGWTFPALAADPELLPLAVRAMRESWAAAEVTTGTKRPFGLRLLSPFLLRRVLGLAPLVLSFNLERFFAYHYVKVADQSLLNLRAALQSLKDAGVEHEATAEMLRRIERARGV